jgi:glutathione S-transferase
MMTGEPPDRVAIDAVLPDVRKQISILDNAIAKTGYLVDDQFTLADLNLLPILIALSWRRKGQKLSLLRPTWVVISRSTRPGRVFSAPHQLEVHQSAQRRLDG